ncbi:MAG: energy-coupling factor ABC transporter ATP-binding protein [Candidatus Thorarchaeota archaeon]|nr:MAG: energy-coupling factor ABC transporter ATP-binding protein [Candidatus Thorarchaeota archaeon]
MTLVEFVDFSFKYLEADSLALKHINLKIDPGEYIVVTGPSGCGKTTLCRAINGLVPHFHRGYVGGHVYVDSKDTRNSEVAELATIAGLVFQDPSNQLVTLNVEKEIAFGPENLAVEPKEIRFRVEDLICRLKLEPLRDKHPHEMSGGEQQRVAMAATLALRPKILVADEPTSNLDPQSAQLILDLIADLNRQGMTVLLVEHRLDLVSNEASRLILMDKGSIVADGAPRDVLVQDLCQEIGVGIPKATQVYKQLKRRGVTLGRVPLTGKELAALVKEARQA